MINENRSGNRFVIDLGDFKLSDEEEEQLGAEIRDLVLRSLANSTLSIKIPLPDLDIYDKFYDETGHVFVGMGFKGKTKA